MATVHLSQQSPHCEHLVKGPGEAGVASLWSPLQTGTAPPSSLDLCDLDAFEGRMFLRLRLSHVSS